MRDLSKAQRVVIKIGSSNITYSNGRLNIRRVEELVKTIADIKNSGRTVIMVSSGAQAVGTGKLGFKARPDDMPGKQAVAAVGQCELMYIYDKLFSEYNHSTAQVLLTRGDIEDPQRKTNLKNTFTRLIDMGCLPIVNENDSVATEEIEFGDNDTLSAVVGGLVEANLLIILSDIDGFYDKCPSDGNGAKLIPQIDEVTDEIRAMAAGSGSKFGTGGMVTKLNAAEYAGSHGMDMIIMNGAKPSKMYNVLEGEVIGTYFPAQKKDC